MKSQQMWHCAVEFKNQLTLWEQEKGEGHFCCSKCSPHNLQPNFASKLLEPPFPTSGFLEKLARIHACCNLSTPGGNETGEAALKVRLEWIAMNNIGLVPIIICFVSQFHQPQPREPSSKLLERSRLPNLDFGAVALLLGNYFLVED